MDCSSVTRRYALGRFGQQGREEEKRRRKREMARRDDSDDQKGGMVKGKVRNKGITGRYTETRKEEERRESTDIYVGTGG